MKSAKHHLFALMLPVLAPVADAAVIFSDSFTASSTLNSGSPTAATATSTAYQLFSSKTWNPTPTLNANDLRFGIAATTSGQIEVQARFANAPLSLMFSNDLIELTVVFTNTSGLFTQAGHVGFGLYNSGGVPPLAGGLDGTATNGSPSAIGGAQRWRGYVARIAYSGGNHRLATRPAQSILCQDLLTEGSNSDSYTNGATLATAASTFTRTAGSLLTEVFRLTRSNAFTLRIESRLYLGGNTNGTLLVSQTATATGANFLNSSFDSLAVGWRATANTTATLMDIKSVTVNYVGPSYPPPTISLNGGALVTNECHTAFTDPGAIATGVPLGIAGGYYHGLALKSDGRVAAWGYNSYGQTNVPSGLSNVVGIAGGQYHSLALKGDGTLAAWGYNSYGQTTIPTGLSNLVAIAAGYSHSMAIKRDGTVIAWGDGSYGQTNVPVGLSNVVAIAGGIFHSVALRSDGTVAAWGDNLIGQTNIPSGLSNVVAIAAGGVHNLALKSDGKVAAWGDNNFGQLNTPSSLSNVVAIAAGERHNLALKSDGTVVAWGYNASGQTNVPVGLSNAVAVAAGGGLSLALKRDGSVVAWGDNTYGQTNIPAGLSVSLPVNVSGSVDTNTPGGTLYLLTYTTTNFLGSIAISTRAVVVHDTIPPVLTLLGDNPLTTTQNIPFVDPGATALDACGGTLPVTTNSTVKTNVPGTYFVRYTATDSSGNSATNSRWVRVVIPPVITLNGGATVTNECHTAFTDPGSTATGTPLAIAGGAYHSLALKSDGTVIAWGYNGDGQTNIPVGLSNVVAIAGGAYHNLALNRDGMVAAWGINFNGQTDVPASLSNVVAIAGGAYHNLALKRDGMVAAWGYNYYGQTDVPASLSNVVAVAVGTYHSLTLKSDGRVVAWGYNATGQTNIPVGLSNVVAIAAGDSHSLALKSDGKVVAWGYNGSGQTNISAGLSNVVAIAAGSSHSLALKSDGKVVAWGNNGNGQTNIPVGLSNVVAIAAGQFHNLALKSDGTVVAWGHNSSGQTNVPGGLSVSLPFAVSGSLDTNTPGSYDLTYTATNSLGAVGTATRNVVVQDALPPVITLLGDNPLTTTLNVPFVDPGATALDACGGILSVTTNSTVNLAVPGTYAIAYTSLDSSGNTASTTRWAQVILPPVITLNGDAVVTNECHTSFTDSGATASGAPLAIAAGAYHSLVLRSDGMVAAWGWNDSGQTSMPEDLGNVAATAGGGFHNMALKSDGAVAAWGRNDEGQTNLPAGLSNMVTIAAGRFHSLVVKSDGTVVAWGYNNFGQTNAPVALTNVVAVAGGWYHSLALRSDGTVAAWGAGTIDTGSLPNYGQSIIPVGLSNVMAIAAGAFHNLALKIDGTVVAWGYDSLGQTTIPVGLTNVVAIAAGGNHSLALKSDGTVVAWGLNNFGETNIPAGLSNVVAIAAGDSHNLALKNNGTIVVWGRSDLGQTNVPAGLAVSLPVTVSGTVDTNTPGNYELTYTATNSLGGVASVTRTVVVQDTLPPVITLLGDNPLTTTLNVPFVDPGATALDGSAGSLPVTTNSTVNLAVPGTYAITYTATDSSGNTASTTRWVQVVIPPLITLNGDAVVTNECHADFTDPGATAVGGTLAIAVGAEHSLALKSDGTVVGWGAGSVETSGLGYDYEQSIIPVGLSNVVVIAGGGFQSFALKSDGTVVAWGANSAGQTDVPAGLSNVVNIAGGYAHSLALKNDGTVVAWGDNFYGQTNIPAGLNNVVAIAAGHIHNLALKSDGTIIAWGDNTYGRTIVPAGLSNVVAIAGGAAHSLALKSDGTIVAWGDNSFGVTNVPLGLSNVVAIAGGELYSLALKSDGTVIAWGDNSFGQTNIPAGLSNVVAIVAGFRHSLALKSDGTVVGWGRNNYGQTNIPAELNISLPVTVSGSIDTNTPGSCRLTYTATNILGGIGTATRTVVVQDTLPPVITLLGDNPLTTTLNDPFVDPGATALDVCGGSLPVTTNSTVNLAVPGTYAITYTATDNSGNAATNTRTVVVNDNSPTNSPFITLNLNGSAIITNECHAAFTDPSATAIGAPLAIAVGGLYSLALRSDGTVAAWGNNEYGQTNIPVGLSNVVAIAGGFYHSLALNSGGTVAAWGNNDSGRATIPVGLSNVVAIAAGGAHSLALKSDGTVAAWGWNGEGQTTIPAGLSNVVAIAAGGEHSLALKSNGTVVAWGHNNFGQTNIPVGLSNVVAIAGGAWHSLALKSDGMLVAWGQNDNGQTNTPVGLSNVVAIAGGAWHNLALQTDGTVAAWGYNDAGQTNIPAGLSVSLPVTVSGSLDTNTPGNYELTYTATNILGGSATVTRTVVVLDTLPPVITLLGDNPLITTLNVSFVDPGATALDACGGSLAVSTNSDVNTNAVGSYLVTYIATDNYGNAATNTRVVQVVAPLPVITAQPASMTIACGTGPASFSVTASGEEPLSYQWYFNDTVIPGATTTNYMVNPATPAHAGGYTVVITNVHGAITSSVAMLTLTNQTPTVATADSFSLSPGGTLLIAPASLTGNDVPGVCDGASTELTFLSISPSSVNGGTLEYIAPGTTLWTNRYNGPANGEDAAYAMAVDGNGDVYVTGSSSGVSSSEDYATIKYSSAGVPLWTNRYDGPANGADLARAIAVDANGNVFVTGESDGSSGYSDYATVAYSGAGEPLWTNRYDGNALSDFAKAVAVDANGNVFVTGYSYSAVGGNFSDYATVAYTGAGVPLWTNRFNGPGNNADEAYGVATDGTNVFVTGQSYSSGSHQDAITLAYSSIEGELLWTHRFNGILNYEDSSEAITVDESGNIYLAGRTAGAFGKPDFLTLALSSEGEPVWTNSYNGNTSSINQIDQALGIVVQGGKVLVTGYSQGNGTSYDYATIAYATNGVSLWTNRYDGPGNNSDQASSLAVDAGGNVFVTGSSDGGDSSLDFATLAYDSAGLPVWTNRYNGPGNASDRANAVKVGTGGNIFVTGASEGSSSSSDYATIAYSSGKLVYTPPPGFVGTDAFTYMVQDGYGLRHTGTVAVAVGVVVNTISTEVLPGGAVQLGFYGVPGQPYALERTSDLFSGGWSALQTNTAAANGALGFTTQPVGSANFWRIRVVP